MISRFFQVCLLVFCSLFCRQERALASDVSFLVYACVPSWELLGSIHFDIDTAQKSGPFFVRLEGPNGLLDTMEGFSGPSYTYTGLKAGEYIIEIQCCATCSARCTLEVKSYTPITVTGRSVMFTQELTLPLIDSSALLVALTEFEKDQTGFCDLNFSLYNAQELSLEMIHKMLEQCMVAIQKIQNEAFQEGADPDAWLEEEVKLLARFDEKGDLLWVYSAGF